MSATLGLGLLGLALLWPPLGAAQVTLVIRSGGEAEREVDGAIDDALRDVLGGSVRRVDTPLDDLALAAGCGARAAGEECVATVASAAGARLVVLQHVTREGDAWGVTLDVRRSDGRPLRQITVHCGAGSGCAGALDDGFAGRAPPGAPAASEAESSEMIEPGPSTLASVTTESTVERRPARSEGVASERVTAPVVMTDVHVRAPENPRGGADIPVLPNVLFGSAALVAVGAGIAGALSITYAGDAAGLGVVRSEADVDRVRSLEGQSAAALGASVGLVLLGAGLAVAGTVVLVEGRGASPRVSVAASGLRIAF